MGRRSREGLRWTGLICAVLLLLAPAAAWAGCFEETDLIEEHEQTYFLVYSKDSRVDPDRDGREAEEFIFQFSVRKNLLSCHWFPLYFGYSQRSFWQFYDWEGSAPFRESNYHPELFVDYTLTWLKKSKWGLRVGIEHESNGQTDPLSRSWNRNYAKVSYAADALAASLRFWDRWDEGSKNPPTDLSGDDNPYLLSYRGSWEAQVVWAAGDRLHLVGLARRGKADVGQPVSGQLDLDWHMGNRVWLRVEWYRGYGDNLIDHDRAVSRVGIGFAFKDPGDLRALVR